VLATANLGAGSMYAAYFDESGDSGIVGSPTTFFVLACVLVHETTWLDALDALIGLRRDLKGRHGIPMRPEIEGKHFKNGRGVFDSLGWLWSNARAYTAHCSEIKPNTSSSGFSPSPLTSGPRDKRGGNHAKPRGPLLWANESFLPRSGGTGDGFS